MEISQHIEPIRGSYEWNGETVTFSLNRNSFGLVTSKDFMSAVTDQDSEAMARVLSRFIESWDVTLHGEPFEPTHENLLRCPPDFVSGLVTRIGELNNPDPTQANDLPNGSEPAESSLAESTEA